MYIHTTEGSEIESNKLVPQVSTIMHLLTSKDGDLSSYFDNIKENVINHTSLKEKLIDIHIAQANKGKVCGRLRLEQMFKFCKTFNRITKKISAFI